MTPLLLTSIDTGKEMLINADLITHAFEISGQDKDGKTHSTTKMFISGSEDKFFAVKESMSLIIDMIAGEAILTKHHLLELYNTGRAHGKNNSSVDPQEFVDIWVDAIIKDNNINWD